MLYAHGLLREIVRPPQRLPFVFKGSRMKNKTIVILATLDTKAPEARFMKEEIQALGGTAMLLDLGVVGQAGTTADITREEIASLGGVSLEELLRNPTRERSQPIIVKGAILKLRELLDTGRIDGALALGGTQGTSINGEILQSLPYGFPKVLLSTAASGDTSHFVGIKDITMMFSVSDILGLNVFSERILANAAACAMGMAQVERNICQANAKGVVGITNLGVLTKGAMHAIKLLESAGFQCITFHAIGAGGDAMEQMMKEGIITAVFDYAMGDIADGVFGVLRGASDTRLTTAGKLGLPQVLVPGGSEHLGILTDPNVTPPGYEDHDDTWHSPVIYVPRVNEVEQGKIAEEIGKRLSHTSGNAVFLYPLKGVSRYSNSEIGEIQNADLDAKYWEQLQNVLPESIKAEALNYHAEAPEFIEYAVSTLIGLIEKS